MREAHMPWSWRYEDAKGGPVNGPAETFASQADAESWIGQAWRDLTGGGVATVVLVEDNRVEYRMSLAPAGD
jgi:hypothetical protein